jgi:hypothetical protein
MSITNGQVNSPGSKAPFEFVRIETSCGQDGAMYVNVAGTLVEQAAADEFEMINQELAARHVSSIDDALVLIEQQARRAFAHLM